MLTAEEFERHEALTLQRTLDRMADLVYCPRCSQPVIEDSTHCAQCTRCRLELALLSRIRAVQASCLTMP